MIKVGIADYGLNVWYGGMYDYRDRLGFAKKLGYDGVERLEAGTAEEAINGAAYARSEGLGFGTCLATTPANSLRFTAALGLKYMWVHASPAYLPSNPMETYCRKVNAQIEVAERYGVKVGVHNHMGLRVQTEEELDTFLANCPKAGIVFDVGHMAVAGGDILRITEKYFDRILTVHMKDYKIMDKDYVYADRNKDDYTKWINFCELGAGEMGDLNLELLNLLKKKGYDGWIFVEHDHHKQDPAIDLAKSREFIRRAGI